MAGPEEREGESVEDAAARVAQEVEHDDDPRPDRTGPDGAPLGGEGS